MTPLDANDDLVRALRSTEQGLREHDVGPLRRRILTAAGPALAARAAGAREGSWFESAARFGRVAIPASVVAALAATVLLALLPMRERSDAGAELTSQTVGALLGLGTTADLGAYVLFPSADEMLVTAAAPEPR